MVRRPGGSHNSPASTTSFPHRRSQLRQSNAQRYPGSQLGAGEPGGSHFSSGPTRPSPHAASQPPQSRLHTCPGAQPPDAPGSQTSKGASTTPFPHTGHPSNPQTLATSLTQTWSHQLPQQYGSARQMRTTQATSHTGSPI